MEEARRMVEDRNRPKTTIFEYGISIDLFLQRCSVCEYPWTECVRRLAFCYIGVDERYTKRLELQLLPSIFTTHFCTLCFW